MIKAIFLSMIIFCSIGCAGWQTQVKDQSSAAGKCMSACAASCLMEAAKDLLVCPVPK